MIPQVMSTARVPYRRTSRPARTTPAPLATVVRIRAISIPLAVPVALATRATGVSSSVIPGGWTMTKSR